MANTLKGSGYWLGIGEESTWNSAATRTKWFKPVSDSLSLDVMTAQSRKLYGLVAQGLYEQRRSTGGSVGLELGYTGYLKILKAILGAATDTVMTSGQSYRHEFARGTPTALTVERNMDGKNLLFTGMKISSAEFKFTPNDLIMVDLTLVGPAATDNSASASTPTFVTERLILPAYSVLSWAATALSTACVVKSLTVRINNNLTTDRYVIGSTTPAAPIQSGISDCTWSAEIEADDTSAWALWTDYTAQTARKLKIVLDSNVSIGSSSDKYLLKLESPNAVISSCPNPINDKGPIPMTVDWMTYDSADTDFDRDSDQTGDVKITLQNAEATT